MDEKKTSTKPLIAVGAKIGDPVPRAIVDTNTASVGIPPQAEVDTQREITALREQVERLQQQLVDASSAVKSGARQTVRQTEAKVKLYPLSSLLTVAAVVAAFALAITRSKSFPQRSRNDRAIDHVYSLYDNIRGRI